VQECQAALSINEPLDLGAIYFDPLSRNLNIDAYQKVKSVRIMSITGQIVQNINIVGSSAIAIDRMNTGIYLFEIQTEYGRVVKRFYLD
jgi:hypothetical protein